MKAFLAIGCMVAFIAGCGSGNQINGHSLATANKSIKHIKDRLSEKERLEFELSFWTLRDELKDDQQFLQTIDGKNPYELMELGQASFTRRKAAGFKDYQAFSDWEVMLADYARHRFAQIEPSKDAEKEARYKKEKRTVLYNLR
jgi:hypothetical protein